MVKPASYLFLSTLWPDVIYAAQPITDKSLEREILAAVFPAMPIQTANGSIDNSWRPRDHRRNLYFPDALATETVYHVSGRFADDTERCAAEKMATSTFSETRELRMRLERWPAPPIAVPKYWPHFLALGCGNRPVSRLKCEGAVPEAVRPAALYVAKLVNPLHFGRHEGVVAAAIEAHEDVVLSGCWGA